MSIIGAEIISHLPLLVPTIGKDQALRLQPVVKAIKKLVKKYGTRGVDTILIISDHNNEIKENFIIKLCPNYTVRLDEFGDLTTRLSFSSDINLAYKIKESLETKTNLILNCDLNLEYSFAVPLYFWQTIIPTPSIIPVLSAPARDALAQYNFGKYLQTIIQDSSQRVLVLVTGDLSHQDLSKNEKNSKDFDSVYLKTLRSNNLNNFLNFPESLLGQTLQCIYNPTLILAGLLENMHYSIEVLAYNTSFHTGLTVAEIII
jgi:aromatic ring-opening dioxygenase LigB subunit